MPNLVSLLVLLPALAACRWAWVGVRSDPRNLANAGRLALAAVLIPSCLAMVGDATLARVVVVLLALSPVAALALVAFLLHNGIQMIRREGRSLGNQLSLLAGLGIAAAMALALGLFLADPNLLPISLWLVLAGGWAATVFFGYVGYAALYDRLARRTHPDYVVTLGCGLSGGRVTPLLAGRVDRAIDLYRVERAAGRRPLLVMSGGQGADEERSEAAAMGEYALTRGVPAEDLLLEGASRTTRENLVNSASLVGTDPRLGVGARGLAVTSDYHAMRAASLARELELPVGAVGAPTAGYFWPSAVLREFVAVLRGSVWAQLLGFVLVTLPLPMVLALATWS